MTEVILTPDDMFLMLYLVEQEMGKVEEAIPSGSNLPVLYEKLLDICELEIKEDNLREVIDEDN